MLSSIIYKNHSRYIDNLTKINECKKKIDNQKNKMVNSLKLLKKYQTISYPKFSQSALAFTKKNFNKYDRHLRFEKSINNDFSEYFENNNSKQRKAFSANRVLRNSTNFKEFINSKNISSNSPLLKNITIIAAEK